MSVWLTRLSVGHSERGVPSSEWVRMSVCVWASGLGVRFIGAKSDTQMTLHKNEDSDNDDDDDDGNGDDDDDEARVRLCDCESEWDNNDFKWFVRSLPCSKNIRGLLK